MAAIFIAGEILVCPWLFSSCYWLSLCERESKFRPSSALANRSNILARAQRVSPCEASRWTGFVIAALVDYLVPSKLTVLHTGG